MNIIINLEGCYIWGEEGKKLFIFLRNVYLNSSHAQHAEKKLLKLKLPEKTVMQLHNAVAAVLKKNFQLNMRKAKLTFTAC